MPFNASGWFSFLEISPTAKFAATWVSSSGFTSEKPPGNGGFAWAQAGASNEHRKQIQKTLRAVFKVIRSVEREP